VANPKYLDLGRVDTVGAHLEGQTLQGLYYVEELVGQGGMAWVYKATHVQLGGDVALKILFSDLSDHPEKKERFLLEARIQNQLDHPHIVRVQNIIQTDELLGFVMEWCNAGNLLGWLKKAQGKLSIEQLQALFPPLLDAVGYAHSEDVIHRDIKPHNILLHKSGDTIVPKIADFGIARVLRSVRLTGPGEMMGTLEYAAPEQLKDSKNVDHRSDIYSLGVLLYRMSTGRLPFVGSPASLIKGVTEEPPIPPDEAPAALQPLIIKCLQKDPDRRFQSCLAFREAFSAATSLKDAHHSIRGLAPSALGGQLTPHAPSVATEEAQSLHVDDSVLEPLEAPPTVPDLEEEGAREDEERKTTDPSSPPVIAPGIGSRSRPGPRSARRDAPSDANTNDFYGAISSLRAEQDAHSQRRLLFGGLIAIIAALLGIIVYLVIR